jgi:transposase InsO family protein
MSRKGNCWDNAVAESFFRSLKVEAIKGFPLKSHEEAFDRVFDYIEGFYNTTRIHSFLMYLSPDQWEARAQADRGLVQRRQRFLNRVSEI